VVGMPELSPVSRTTILALNRYRTSAARDIT
jgi:hypothetical protein